MAICCKLAIQAVCRAFSRARVKTGSAMAMSTVMIAMTTSNSISVNPVRRAR